MFSRKSLAEKADYIVCKWRHCGKLYPLYPCLSKIKMEPSYNADVGVS